uniref:Uncharacterized protein n=1 Tax=Cacopsylla melanoneura TaxID=428564 RepID=A0A8D8YIW6_9HEMI
MALLSFPCHFFFFYSDPLVIHFYFLIFSNSPRVSGNIYGNWRSRGLSSKQQMQLVGLLSLDVPASSVDKYMKHLLRPGRRLIKAKGWSPRIKKPNNERCTLTKT